MTIYPNSIEHARCRLCLERIAWALTYPNRKRVPLDVPISTHDSHQLDPEGHEIAELTSQTHFATCAEYDEVTRKAKVKPKPISQGSLFG